MCNSQQLSNKALLTGHLAFRHEHAHAHARQFSGSSSAKSGADSAFTNPEYVPSKTRQDSRCCCCAGVPDEEASGGGGIGPEAFFPRCWDLSDGGVTSLLKGFAVSAAAALLRRAVEADVRECTTLLLNVRYAYTSYTRTTRARRAKSTPEYTRDLLCVSPPRKTHFMGLLSAIPLGA